MADGRDHAALLHSRLNSYGPAKPRSLVAPPRRPGSSNPQLEPLSGAGPLSPKPALRKRTKPDPALYDAAASGASPLRSDSKAALTAGAELLGASSLMPFSKMARKTAHTSSAVNISDPSGAPAAEAEVDADARRSAGAGGAKRAVEQKRDLFWFIRMLRTELSDHEFAYMNVADTEAAVGPVRPEDRRVQRGRPGRSLHDLRGGRHPLRA